MTTSLARASDARWSKTIDPRQSAGSNLVASAHLFRDVGSARRLRCVASLRRRFERLDLRACQGRWGVDTWLRIWEGFGNAIGPIVGFLLQFVAGYIGPYLQALHEHPAITLVLVLTIVSLYLLSNALANAISELTYKAWTKHGAEHTDGAISRFGRGVRWLRSNEFSKGAYSAGANVTRPSNLGCCARPFPWRSSRPGHLRFPFRRKLP